MATSTLGSGTLVLAGTTSGTTTVTATAVAGTTTLTLPAATDTLVGKGTTDTLTNKTLTGAVMNGTLGATTPSTVAATTLTTSSTVTHNGGTANGVAYLDGSKVLTTGSALVFDGTNLGVGVTPSAWNTAGGAALQIKNASLISYGNADVELAFNSFFNGTNYKYIANGFATRYDQVSGTHAWFNAASGTAGNTISFTQAMTLDASGNLLVGTTTSTSRLVVATKAAGTNTITLVGGLASTSTGDSAINFQGYNSSGGFGATGTILVTQDASGNTSAGRMTFSTSAAGGVGEVERARIDSSGNLYALSSVDGVVSASSLVAGTSNNIFLGKYSATTTTNGTTCYAVRTNGNVINTNNSYGAISDAKLKENIVDATPKLANLMQVKVRNYNMIGDTTKQIGVVAQELETVFPSMIDEAPDRDAEGNDLGTTTKSVKYSVFVPMLIKAIQEQQALITQLQADVAALKGA